MRILAVATAALLAPASGQSAREGWGSVRRGQVMARIGDSGDAREPHLHFQVSTSSDMLAGEGVPYVIDRYRARSADPTSQIRIRELPVREMLVDFGSVRGDRH